MRQTAKTALFLITAAIMMVCSIAAYAATYTYDELDHLKTVTYSSGKKVTYSYDAAGNIVSTAMSIPNIAPVITEGASVSVTMSKNASPTPFSLTLHATDANNDVLTWSLTTAASHGTAATSGTGSSKWIAYAPTSGYIGTDSFVASVADGNGGIANITVNVTVTQTYTVTYNGNGSTGGAVPTDSNAYLSGATVTVLGNAGNLAKTGYSFVGWNTLANGSGTSYAVAATFSMGTANVTLYAQWSVLPAYTVSYTGNGSIGGAVPIDSIAYLSGATVTVFGNTGNLTKTGYTFKGWNTAANGAGTPYAAASTFSMGAANVMLYAQWTVVDTTGPTLTVSSLANNAITNNATLNVSGTVSDTNGVASLKINNTAVAIINGNFSHAVTLQEGSNTIIISATDTLGNSTTDTRTITLDITKPALTLTAPADNSKTAQPLATVSGTIDETSTVTVKLNSGTAQNAAITGSSFSADVTLASGLNTITITATDLATNTTSVVRTVTYDNSKPSIAITAPNQDITVNQTSLTVSGTVSDTLTAATVTLSFNNQTYTPTVTNDTFTQQLTIPAEGTFAIIATATDEVGNSSSATRNVIYAAPINGVCGTSAGQAQGTAPTTNLCSVGTATAITGTGPWSWSCAGSNSGTTASCTASLYVDPIVVPRNARSAGAAAPTISDALKVLQAIVGITPLTAADQIRYDVAPLGSNGMPVGNGAIDAADVILILRRSIGIGSW